MNKKMICITLILSGTYIECSFMQRVIPSTLLMGATGYVSLLYYYNHFTNTVIPNIVRQATTHICSFGAIEPTRYCELATRIQNIKNQLGIMNIYGDISSSITYGLRDNQVGISISIGLFNRIIYSLVNKDIVPCLNNKIKLACRNEVDNIIDRFFTSPSGALHGTALNRSYCDDGLGSDSGPYSRNYIQELSATLHQMFPNNSPDICERYQQHIAETRKHTLM